LFMFFFFFSSRRRHTRFSRDWSSDVCSSDLSHCRTMLFTYPHQWQKSLSNPLQLCLIGQICVFNDLKSLFICIVAWIDPYFFDNGGSNLRCIWGKMDVCN